MKEINNTLDRVLRGPGLSEILCERPSWMEGIPPGDLTLVAAFPGIMYSKSFYAKVPERLVMLDQEPLGHRYPKRLDDKKPTREITKLEVRPVVYGALVLAEAATELVSDCSRSVRHTLSFALVDRFANLTRPSSNGSSD